MTETLEQKLEKQLEEANEKLISAEEECKKLKVELADAKKYQHMYKSGEEMGKNFVAVLTGMEAGGMTHEDALDILKATVVNSVAPHNTFSLF